jgi:hypothetical protein
VAIGAEHDVKIISLLALGPMSTARLAPELKVDEGGLTVHMINNLLAKEKLIRVVGADGSSPVWALTEQGQELHDRRRA